MSKSKLTKDEKRKFKELGRKVKTIILEKKGYKSLDRFSLEHHDCITKPTLYAICDGNRDMQLSTLLRLAKALEVSVLDLLGKD